MCYVTAFLFSKIMSSKEFENMCLQCSELDLLVWPWLMEWCRFPGQSGPRRLSAVWVCTALVRALATTRLPEHAPSSQMSAVWRVHRAVRQFLMSAVCVSFTYV